MAVFIYYLRDFSDPLGIGSGTCPFGKNSDILLQIGNFHLTYYYLVLILTCTCIITVNFFFFSIFRGGYSRQNPYNICF